MANLAVSPAKSEPPRYTPLDADRREIRLLQIAGGRPSAPIEVTLHTVSLDDAPEFAYLSYTWGFEDHKETIRCDGGRLEVLPKLFRILRNLRDSKNLSVKLFWIDVICINQLDMEEKGVQVELMHDITRRARLTIGWPDIDISQSTATYLGDVSSCGHGLRPAHITDGVLGLLQNSTVITTESLAHYEAAYQVVLAKMSAPTTAKPKRRCWGPSKLFGKLSGSTTARVSSPSNEHDMLAELCHLVDSDYFSRMWILPDIVLSSRLLLRCGSVDLEWNVLSNALEAMIMYGTQVKLKAALAENLLVANLMRYRYRHNQLSFSESLLGVQSCTFAATNLSDRIYALYPFQGSDEIQLPQVDYSLDTQQLYQRISGVLGDTFNAPIFLALSCPPGRRHEYETQAVSWVPQYDIRSQRMLLAHPNCHFLASKATYSNLVDDSPWLRCQGCIVDEIGAVKSYLPPRRICDQYDVAGDNLFEFFRWYQFASGEQKAPTATSSDEVLLRFAETIQARGSNHVWERAVSTTSSDTVRCVRAFLQYLMDPDVLVTNEIRLFSAACLPSHDRCFGKTIKGRFCLLPPGVGKGDLVCLIRGSKVPVLLRKSEENYTNAGECYVHGIMHGEIDGIEEEILLE
ncbi:hypothetical protein LTR56_007310 [Elasticomyces elasticus]|nr:hypothetical protein LTR56_007310 [Elasticomyces elasticus]KAK3662958.1 hypothetical protein LTR22_006122 [Elasticomyces elasticus]KAK4918924.1 hypothetical protein LTR49_013396 [Elasticomyces elasticus]KAK5753809.1 hypothetical protein LTS12_016118 [Elasticomyces elasticus]